MTSVLIDMKAQLLTSAAVVTIFAGVSPSLAADQQLLNLLMPDAKVVAGINVDQAKGSPFGQYVLSQMVPQDQHMKDLTLQTGFDPTRDVRELLVASNGDPGKEAGLALATGNFNVAGVTAAATQHGGTIELYRGASIVKDPEGKIGIGFLSGTLVAAGDLVNVKAAIDRQTSPASLPSALLSQINEWSNSQDAWIVTAVPPNTLTPRAGTPKVPGLGPGQDAFQSIQRAGAGVRFGSLVTMKVQGDTDTSQSAQQMADALKLLASLAQMQGGQDPTLKSLLAALTIGSTGNQLNVSISMPSEQFIALTQPKKPVRRQLQQKK